MEIRVPRGRGPFPFPFWHEMLAFPFPLSPGTTPKAPAGFESACYPGLPACRMNKTMVLDLIRTLMAPNLDPRASPGSFFRAGSPGSHQIQPSCQKWTEILRDLGRDFRIFRIFPKWKTAGMVGQDSAWEVQKHYFRSKNLGFLSDSNPQFCD